MLNEHNYNNVSSENVRTNAALMSYQSISYHWFYQRNFNNKLIWEPFSKIDSNNLENAFNQGKPLLVATDGGRFDVNVEKRIHIPVYWSSEPNEVRRCSWFYKNSSDSRYVPYTEDIAELLESEYKIAYETNTWHRKVNLKNGENVVFHSADILVHFVIANTSDMWGNTPQTGTRPRVIKRGFDDFSIEPGETETIDHLLFIVHGIGPRCDLKMRSLIEVVNDFRNICHQLVQSHYTTACQQNIANRIEVLPITWHANLHTEEIGTDAKLKKITLESIPRLRDFTNDTLLDILFYTSPVYSQTITSRVGNEINRIYDIFKKRNPSFNSGISVAGHSLGSLILFDILCHQNLSETVNNNNNNNSDSNTQDENCGSRMNNDDDEKPHPLHRRMSKRINYMMSVTGTGQTRIHYPQLSFSPKAFFALGSPIGMFVTVRGLDTLGENFSLPTCPAFLNIFHPYDPVAYRIEPLVNPEAVNLRPYLVPHHKGRKRMHLELKETMVRVGADIKQKFFDSLRNTWNSFYHLTTKMENRIEAAPHSAVVEHSVSTELECNLQPEMTTSTSATNQPNIIVDEVVDTNISMGKLNRGRRIDYVLQEAPVEFFNEYLFALQSHICYWESSDTLLLILKEIYDTMGIQTDSQVPQQTMSIQPD